MGLSYVTVNAKKAYRMDSLLGENYYVVPMTMIVPGVLEGSDGPLLYPQETVTANVSDWNGMPITNGHPINEQNIPISARSPSVVNNYLVGWVFESKDKDGALTAEAWVSERIALEKNPQIIANIKAGKKFELSTGLFKELEASTGVHNNVTYNAKVTKITPDHLAFLTDKKGACSLDDGCGVLVNSAPDRNYLPLLISKELTVNELSFSDVRDELSKQIADKYSTLSRSSYVVAVYDKYVIFEDYPRYNNDGVKLSSEPTKLYKVGYSKTKDVVTIEDNVTEVKYQATYVPVNNSKGEDEMKLTPEERSDLIGKLVANCGSCEGEKKTFEALSDDTLKALVANKTVEPKKEEVVNNSAQKKEEPQTTVLSLSSLPKEVQDLVANAKKNEEELRGQLVKTVLTANEKAYTKEQLEAMPMDTLRIVANFASTVVPSAPTYPSMAPNYVGAAGLTANHGSSGFKPEPLSIPTINYNDK